jgi:hypothetical protein
VPKVDCEICIHVASQKFSFFPHNLQFLKTALEGSVQQKLRRVKNNANR